jgi:hypothetical protein
VIDRLKSQFTLGLTLLVGAALYNARGLVSLLPTVGMSELFNIEAAEEPGPDAQGPRPDAGLPPVHAGCDRWIDRDGAIFEIRRDLVNSPSLQDLIRSKGLRRLH